MPTLNSPIFADQLAYQIDLATGKYDFACCLQDDMVRTRLVSLAESLGREDFMKVFKLLWLKRKGICMPVCPPAKDCAPRKPGDVGSDQNPQSGSSPRPA